MVRSKHFSRLAVGGLVLLGFLRTCVCEGASPFQDMFGRDIGGVGITLVDWEGYMANPAIQFSIFPPAGASPPVDIIVRSLEPRLYFEMPSVAGRIGPQKTMHITDTTPVSMSVAIFPARVKRQFDTSLDIRMADSRNRQWRLKLPIHVIFNQADDNSPTYPIIVDFSQDRTAFYSDQTHQDTFRRAVLDWEYYLADMDLARVPAGEEKTWIFEPEGFGKSHLITNARSFAGFLMYTYGMTGPEMRSGGESSKDGDFEMAEGVKLPLKRSGGVEVYAYGNYNKLGWLPPLQDDEWWKGTNMGDVQNDLYSIVHHEMGHALFFNPNNPRFQRRGVLKDPAIEAYLATASPAVHEGRVIRNGAAMDYSGHDIHTDQADGFDGYIDPASLHGAFGNEYNGVTPQGRWLITKLDLLCVQATGYKLRKVDALASLAIQTNSLPGAYLGHSYSAMLAGAGGIPFYDWTIGAGRLPAGLSLDSFTGRITGTPTEYGRQEFTVLLRDYTVGAPRASQRLAITVKP